MPQHAWNITGYNGAQYNLGLFHGEDTHHVVVHCNNRVVAIDFNVVESKTYTIFLDQELCEVSIDHTGAEEFTYDCRINREIDTPLNQLRNQERAAEDRAQRLRLYAAGVIGLVVILVLWLF